MVADHRRTPRRLGKCAPRGPPKPSLTLHRSEGLAESNGVELEPEGDVHSTEVDLLLWSEPTIQRDPAPHGIDALVAAEVGQPPAQLADREARFLEASSDSPVVVLDEEAASEKVWTPLAETLLKSVEEAEPSTPPAEEQAITKLQLLREGVDDPRSSAHLHGSVDLECDATEFGRNLDSRHESRPATLVRWLGEPFLRPLRPDAQRDLAEERLKRIERIRFGNEAWTDGHPDHRCRGCDGLHRWRRLRADQRVPGALAHSLAPPPLASLLECLKDLPTLGCGTIAQHENSYLTGDPRVEVVPVPPRRANGDCLLPRALAIQPAPIRRD